MHIVLIGPPGSGKGTQAKLIAEHYKLPHIFMGGLLRDVAKEKTKAGKYVKRMLNSGTLVPDILTTKILKKRISKKDCKNGFILDGYPRNLNQSRLLGPEFGIDYAIYLKVPTSVVIERLTSRWQCKECGFIYGLELPPKKKGVCDKCHGRLFQRSDDKEKAIRVRIKNFSNLTRPLINYYKKKGVLRTVNGNQIVEEIFEEIKNILK
jgi:adenylate kinase